MSETVLISILGVLSALLSGILSFVLGQRLERQRQTLRIRAEMLRPIEEWLQGAERMIGVLGDTLSSVVLNSPVPVTYSLDERRKVAQFMGEKTNLVLGILQSKSLKTRRTNKLARQLSETIAKLDGLIKFQLLPLDNDILDRARIGALTPDYITHIGKLKLQLDSLVQTAHSLIAKMKTSLT